MEGQNEQMENKEIEETTRNVEQESKRARRRRKEKIRLIPIWLRFVIVIVLLFISLICGLMFGYGVIGDGNPIDAIKPSTWKHILDLITGKEY